MKVKMDAGVMRAGLVHMFTASGAIVALLALQAIFHNEAQTALLWLLLALVIDGVDGPVARYFKVEEHLPQIDGATLDLIVDFLTYVFVPVIFMWRFDLFFGFVEPLFLGVILVSSLYLFVYRDMKGEDNFFNGFPAAWNMVLIVWFILDTSQLFNVLSAIALCGLTFAPLKSVHPLRVERFNRFNFVMAFLWLVLSALLIALSGASHLVLATLWVLIVVWFTGFSVWRSVLG